MFGCLMDNQAKLTRFANFGCLLLRLPPSKRPSETGEHGRRHPSMGIGRTVHALFSMQPEARGATS